MASIADTNVHRARAAYSAGDRAAALAFARDALAAEPDNVGARHVLAVMAGQAGDHDEAARVLDGATEPRLLSMRVRALEAAGRYAEAIAAARAAAEDGDPAARFGLLSLLLRYGRNEEGLAVADTLLALDLLDPQRASVLKQRGHALRALGREAEAAQAYRDALACAPGAVDNWWALADLGAEFDDEELDALRALAENDRLTPGQRAPAAFALARTLEGGDPTGDAARYHAANALVDAPFEPKRFAGSIDRLTAAFTPDVLAERALPMPGPLPVFIVGLPYSGQSLLRRILASHPDIEVLPNMPLLATVKQRAQLLCARMLGQDYLDGIGGLDANTLAELGTRYLEQSAPFRPEGRPHFVDLLPANFEHIGLIHKILPGARLMDLRRDPVDCAWALYRQYFASGTGFAYDLAHIGHYRHGYARLMDHWDAVMPSRVHRVVLEDLADAPEATARALLDHIGVAFDPACLDFDAPAVGAARRSGVDVAPMLEALYGASR